MLSKIISCLFLISFLHVINAVEFQFLNNLPREIQVACQGNPGHAHLHNGGWKLEAGQRMTVQAADNWAGRFWGRTWCNPINHVCKTGDCGHKVQCHGNGPSPPATLVEITLQGEGGLDYYNISLVNGFNLQITMEPLGEQGDSCKKTQCVHDLLSDCPPELRVKADFGNVIGCKSACNQFNTDQYCCRGAYDKPETCKSSEWPVDYAKYFKERCPDAYSYAFDDQDSTFTCKAPAYLITFSGY